MGKSLIRIKQDGPLVVLIIDGRATAMPWDQALELAKGITIQAHKAEAQHPKVIEQTISDGAVLFRSGAPFGITNNPDVQKEIVKEALTNRELRRSNLQGVKSEAVLGTPTLRQLRPNATIAERVAVMSDREKERFRQALTERSN